MNKEFYDSLELAALLDKTHSNIKRAILNLTKDSASSWIKISDMQKVKDGRKRKLILKRDDAMKVIMKLKPQLAFYLFAGNATL